MSQIKSVTPKTDYKLEVFLENGSSVVSLIYLNNTSVADNKFISGDPKFTVENRTLDGKQYLIVKDKEYDGTAAAEVTGISLSGIDGEDMVTASATAAFKDAAAGVDKAVDLSDITLGGEDAGKYTIAQTAADITTAIITFRLGWISP